MDEQPQPTPAELSGGLALIRRRRWYLWTAVIIYLPMIKLLLVIGYSLRVVVAAVGIWLAFTFTLAFIAALARCPRCGNYFHMHGPTLLFMRKCLHCQLHLCADRR